MGTSGAQLIPLWREVLQLSNVKQGESLVVLTGQSSNPLYIDAATNAALDLGAKVFRLDLPPVRRSGAGVGGDPNAYLGTTPLTNNRVAVEAMKQSDMVIDLMFLLFSPEQTEILRAGTRILLAVEPPDILARIFPSLEDKRRVKAAEARLKRAGSMRITSDAGTDLRVELGQYPVLTEYGFADEPGRWDHWPSGFVATWPNEGSATGTVVLDRGDIIFPFKTYVKSPIRLTIRDGYIRKIEGEFDADYLREYMAMFRDPEGYAVSHLGWGLQPKARWTALEMYDKSQTLGMDGRAFYGNFLFSTGPNTEAGGTRSTPCHMDIPMRNCSLFLDDEPMVLKGDVIPEDQRVEGVKAGAR
jgi:2,5-dihydroxypyridine 5,6-dioxygenase